MTIVALVLAAVGSVRLVEEEEAAELGPGLIAFTIVILLVIATFFLIRSMMHHINKVPPTFDHQDPDADPDADRGTMHESDSGDEPKD